MRIASILTLCLAFGCTGEGGTDSTAPKDSTGDPDDVDGDGFSGADDCDDADAAVHVGATEVCNEVDDNCDGTVDEDASDAATWYADSDGDQFGDANAPSVACTAPAGTVADNTDCADTDAEVNPAATEVCNLIDDDCDEDVDEDASDALAWYPDEDGDGYGDGEPVIACTAPADHVEEDGDCDDSDVDWHPGAAEADCTDPNDYNCDGSVAYDDVDGDGFPACEDCDDREGEVNPDAEEICDGVDNNCDGAMDDASATGALTWYADADGDGFGDLTVTVDQCEAPSGFGADATDCDDGDGAVNPAAVELCDGIDNDCDLSTDEATAADAPTWYADSDGDTFGDPAVSSIGCAQPAGYGPDAGDCDDDDAAINPVAIEVCDGADNNCDGAVDEASAADASTWYADADGDLFGDSATATIACAQPAGYLSDATDCDDGDSGVSPAAVEVCDLIDNNCDDTIDEATAADAPTWFADADGDLFGNPDTALIACDQPAGYLEDNLDCDDDNAAINPDASELCDGADNNCDGATDDVTSEDKTTWFSDHDADTFGFAGDSLEACGQPEGYVVDASDCDDEDVAINPDATEVCDGADNDCDGGTDDASAVDRSEWFADVDGDSFGDAASSLLACDAPASHVADATDCDDGAAAINPASDEVCDGVDNNCDTLIDDATAVDQPSWYVDGDGDGYGDATTEVVACDQPADTIEVGSDCDDANASIHPGVTEVCDGADNDCSAATPEVNTATWTQADGTVTDATATFAAGTSSAPVAVDVDGAIDFCGGTWYVSLTATDDLQITGHTTTGVLPILDGGVKATVLAVETDGLEVGLDSVSIQHGEGVALSGSGRTMGGGILCQSASSLSLSSVLATGNHAGVGGFMLVDGCDVVVSDGTIISNTADYGAGIFGISGSILVQDTDILGNTATTTGGGIAGEGSSGLISIDLVDTVVRNNRATYGGGLSAIYEVAMTCTSDTASDAGSYANTASSLGGGLLLYDGGYGVTFASTGCDWGADGGSDDNRTTDVYSYDSGASYEYGSDASFACTSSGCI